GIHRYRHEHQSGMGRGWRRAQTERCSGVALPSTEHSDVAIDAGAIGAIHMGRFYTANLTPTSFTVQADLLELIPATNVPIYIHSFRVFQTNRKGDAAEEEIQIS